MTKKKSFGMGILSKMGLDGSRRCIFKPDIKDKKCKHQWEKMKTKMEVGGIISKKMIEHEYLFCPKCTSVTGDELWE